MTPQLGLFDKPTKETQADKVLQMLRDSEMGVCANEFIQAHVPRFSARLLELRKAGHEIENRKCFLPSHRHQTRQYRYVLLPARKHRPSLSE